MTTHHLTDRVAEHPHCNGPAAVTRGLALLLAVLALPSVGVRAQNASPRPSLAQEFEAAVTLVDSRGNCTAAVPAFEHIASSTDRELAARALLYLGSCYERLGNEKARQAYRRVINQYPDQRAAARQARARLAALDSHAGTPRLTLRPLWVAGPGELDVAGRPSTDGRTLPMIDGESRLVLTDLDLSRRRPAVPLGTATAGRPACTIESEVVVSPDARDAAFSCQVSNDRHEFRVARLDATHPRERLLVAEYLEPLDWSQPGFVLVQRGVGDRHELALIDIQTGRLRTVTPVKAPVNLALLSPDGRWVAYDGLDPADPGRHDVFMVAAEGGPSVAVGTGPSDDLLPGWTPDGRGVLFISDRTGSPGLWLQPVADGRPSGGPQLLEQDLGRVTDVWATTPTGEFIYFRQTGLVKIATVNLAADGHVSGDVDTLQTGQFGSTMMPGWSPDGGRLAYQTTLTGSRVLALGIKDLRTGAERMTATPLRHFVRPQWSPDGRHVAVKGRDREGRYGLFLIDVSSGQASPLKPMPRLEEKTLGAYAWTADGSLLAVVGGSLRRLDIQTRQETELWAKPGRIGRFAPLATGAIAYIRHFRDGTTPVTTIELQDANGSSRELLRAGPDEGFLDLDGFPDGKALIFTRMSMANRAAGGRRWPTLWRLDVDSLEARPLGLSVEGLRDLAVRPDGRRLAFTTGWPTREPWILEHYLPASFVAMAKGGVPQ